MHGVAGELAVVELMVVSVHGAVTIRVVTVPVPGIEATGRHGGDEAKQDSAGDLHGCRSWFQCSVNLGILWTGLTSALYRDPD